jgi:hypothetical protein
MNSALALVRTASSGEFVPTNPVHVGAAREKILRCLSLPSATRVPEGIGDLISRRQWLMSGERLDTIQESQRCGLPECRLRSALAISAATVASPFGKCPGQSAAM